MVFFDSAHDFQIIGGEFRDEHINNSGYLNSFNANGSGNTILGPQDRLPSRPSPQPTNVPSGPSPSQLNHEKCHQLLVDAHRQLQLLLYGSGSAGSTSSVPAHGPLSPPLTPSHSPFSSSTPNTTVTDLPSPANISTAPCIILHHVLNTHSHAILWLLEELNIPFDIKIYPSNPEQFEEYPLGKPPAITEVATRTVLAESGAIVQYLIAKFGGAKLTASADKLLNDLYFVHSCQGTFESILTNMLRLRTLKKTTSRVGKLALSSTMSDLKTLFGEPELRQYVDVLEERLAAAKSTGGWIAGDPHPTAADFVLSHVVEVLCHYYPDLVGPNLKEWIGCVQSRPAYKRAVDKGGRHRYLINS